MALASELIGQGEQVARVVEQSDHTAAWLAFAGAIIVALVAAGTAQWRQRVQLRHEREMRDLEELRRLLDECAVVVAEAASAFIEIHGFALQERDATKEDDTSDAQGAAPSAAEKERTEFDRELAEGYPEALDPAPSHRPKTIFEARERFWELWDPTFGLFQRLVLRLGQDDPIPKSFFELQRVLSLDATYEVIGNTDAGSSVRGQGLGAIREEIRRAHFEFLEESRKRVGVRL